MTAAAIRVVLADDSADLRDVARATLERAGIEVVGDAADGDGAIALAQTLQPDVVVLDVAMSGPSIDELIADLRRTSGAPQIVVYSGWPLDELSGLGVVTVAKGTDPSALTDGVIRAASDERPA